MTTAVAEYAAVERRAFSDVRRNGRRLEGYAATFGAEARIGSFVETIAAGAFRARWRGTSSRCSTIHPCTSWGGPDRERFA